MKPFFKKVLIITLTFFSVVLSAQELKEEQLSTKLERIQSEFRKLNKLNLGEHDSVNLDSVHTDFEREEFADTHFTSAADYQKNTFASATDFSGYEFDSEAIFSHCIFKATISFNNAHFLSWASFKGSQFFDTSYFNHSIFDDYVFFDSVSFGPLVEFDRSRFNSNSGFREVKFGKRVWFTWTEFKGVVTFAGSKFDTIADFSNAEFAGPVYFHGASLPKLLVFKEVKKISNSIDLTVTKLTDYRVRINLTGADIQKFRFRYRRFELDFLFLEREIEALEKSLKALLYKKDSTATYRWREKLSSVFEIKASVYEDVLRMQEVNGFHQSYEILDKEYREFQYTDPGGSYGKYTGQLLNWLDKNWWGYGYDKELIIRNVVLIYLLLSFINAFFIKHLVNNMYTVDGIIEWASSRSKWTISTYFKSIPYSLFYTAVIFFGFKFDIDKLNYQRNLEGWKVFNLLYFILIYTGGLVCLAYLANYIITI